MNNKELFIDRARLNFKKSGIASANQSSKQNQSLALKLDYGKWDMDKFVKRVRERNTKILFIGFGFPKQEYFISEIAKKLDNIVLMAVGGTFDFLSGRIARAPQWIQAVGLEWLFRLTREPWRIRRQLVLPEFVVKVLAYRLFNINNNRSLSSGNGK